jgi:two-component system sensor histidine kinase BaeS
MNAAARFFAVVVVAAIVAGALLQPPTSEWATFAFVLVMPAVIAWLAVPLLRRWVSGRSSVAAMSLAIGVCSLAVGAITSSSASRAMFISAHDYRMFLVLLVLAAGIAFVVGDQLIAPIARDLRRLGAVAEAVADGDLSQRTEIDRRDEIGRAAAAVDRMVAGLADAQRERDAVAGARQHLLSSVSHDLRTPLAAMRAAIESVRDGVADDPDRYLGLVEGHLTMMEQLLDQLHQYARIESGQTGGERELTSMAELADETVEALSPIADRRGIELVAVADGPAPALISASEMSRVLRNLIDNAIRYSPPGGKVAIRVAHCDMIRVSVTDEGPGFPASFRAVAFEPFTRADEAREPGGSSGLGLAIAKALVEGHGGTIALGSGPGGDVVIELPAPVRRTGSATVG